MNTAALSTINLSVHGCQPGENIGPALFERGKTSKEVTPVIDVYAIWEAKDGSGDDMPDNSVSMVVSLVGPEAHKPLTVGNVITFANCYGPRFEIATAGDYTLSVRDSVSGVEEQAVHRQPRRVLPVAGREDGRGRVQQRHQRVTFLLVTHPSRLTAASSAQEHWPT